LGFFHIIPFGLRLELAHKIEQKAKGFNFLCFPLIFKSAPYIKQISPKNPPNLEYQQNLGLLNRVKKICLKWLFEEKVSTLLYLKEERNPTRI